MQPDVPRWWAASAMYGGGVRERWLCRLWRRQRWAALPLATTEGQPLQVVYPGRHTFDHGPDFRDALLVFGDDFARGDVEIHVHSADWRGHGHHCDAHYDRVILHAVWLDDGPPAATFAGRVLPVLAISRWLAVPPYDGGDDEDSAEEEEDVDQLMPCSTAKGGAAQPLADRLALLGEDRLAAKAATLEAALTVQTPAQALYAALLESLGYASNRAPCRELAQRVPCAVVTSVCHTVTTAERVADLEALFIGGAGLLLEQRPTSRKIGEQDDAYANDLAMRWARLNSLWRIPPLNRRDWQFARVRPENFPTRRLAAGARLFAQYATVDLPAAFLGILRSEASEDAPAALEAALAVPAEGYWATHHDFGGRPAAAAHLLGRGRAADAAVNVILPFAIAYGALQDDAGLAARAVAAYRAYPALAENELTRYVARLAFGRNRPRGLAAAAQQGLLHVYHSWCRDKRCGECALASRLGA